MNKTEEKKYTQLRRLGQELHIPVPEHFIELEVFDKDGKRIQTLKQRSHSWVRNTYNLLFSELAGKACDDTTFEAGKLSGKDTAGVVKYAACPGCISVGGMILKNPDVPNYAYMAASGEDGWGILVGSGTNAESFEDYALQTPIAEGTGADQLNHIRSEDHAISYSDTTLKNTLIRYFNNNSGGSIDVNEVALVFKGGIGAESTFLNSRDKLALTVTIPDTGQLKVTYTIELAYPS